MTRRSLLILAALGLGAAGLTYFVLRRGPSPLPAGTPPALLDLAPQDSNVLLYFDVAALRASPFLAQISALERPPKTDREYADFVQATGFDYARDLDRVVVAIRPKGTDTEAFAIADGRFDIQKITAYALRTGKRATRDGKEVIIVPEQPPQKPVTIMFLNSTRILLTNGESLAPLLAQVSSSRSSQNIQPEMREHVSRVAGSPLFAVEKLGTTFERALNQISAGGLRSDQFDNLIRSLRWLSFAARPEAEDFRVTLEGETETAGDAREISVALDGLRLLGKLALSDPKSRRQMDPASLALADAILKSAEVSRDDQGAAHRVRLTFAITPKMLSPATK